jgi:hypothetical protein
MPKVHGPALTVGEVRIALADDHVHMLLLVEEGRLLGTVVRGDVRRRPFGPNRRWGSRP